MKTSTNTLSKISKALLLIATFVMTICFAFLLVACNDNDDASGNTPGGNTPGGGENVGGNDDGDSDEADITKYDATLNASVQMGSTLVSFADILSGTYVTDNDGKYTLTLVFKVGEINVMGQPGAIFVDDNPEDPDKVGDIENGTLGAYNKDGVLVTDGVVATYSSGSDYQENYKQEKVYYVKSAAMPIDTLRSEYSLTMYVNSAIMGKQFSNDSYNAKLTVDLDSGEAVTSISGLGVTTRGVVSDENPAPDEGNNDEDNDDGDDQIGNDAVLPEEGKTVKYDAAIDASFMNNMFSFGGTLTGAYISKNNGDYSLTLTFGTAELTVFTQKANIFVYKGADSQFGYYDMYGEPVTNANVELTYGKGYVLHSSDGYVSCVTSMAFPIESVTDVYYVDIYFGADVDMGNKQYTKAKVTLDLASGDVAENGVSGLGGAAPLAAPKAVTSMTFTVDSVEDSYDLAVYVTAFGATSTSGMQFPYTSNKGVTSNAVLTIDKDSAVESDGETTYSATLNAVVTMGNNDVNFTQNLVKNVVVKEVDNGYEITVNFDYGVVNMPFNNVMTGYMNGAEAEVYGGGTVEPQYGYYDGDTLVTDGVVLTYSND